MISVQMKLGLSLSERRLQEEVREFLAARAGSFSSLPRNLDERIGLLRGWQALCYEAGYVGRSWPAQFGGGGRATVEQMIVDQELAAAGAPACCQRVGGG